MGSTAPDAEQPQNGNGAGDRSAPGADDPYAALPRWVRLLREAAAGVGDLASAHVRLLGAELKLARGAAHLAMFAALAATTCAVAFGLTLLALLGHLLALWLGSWSWALAVLAAGLVLALVAAILVFRHCLHLLSLPESRAQWRILLDDTLGTRHKGDDDAQSPQG